MRLLILVASLLMTAVAMAGRAQAEPYTAARLLADCNANADLVAQGYCVGFIRGAADSLEAASSIRGHRACYPAQVTYGQMRDTVVSWIAANPQHKAIPAVQAALVALEAEYPCD